MTSSYIHRRTAGVLTAALALATAGTAAAHPIGSDAPVPVAPPSYVAHHAAAKVLPPFLAEHAKGFQEATAAPAPSATPRAVVSRPEPGGSSDLVYILVGGGVLAMSGLGGTLAVANRRRTASARPTIAA
jgi:hypothetical protein